MGRAANGPALRGQGAAMLHVPSVSSCRLSQKTRELIVVGLAGGEVGWMPVGWVLGWCAPNV